MPRLSLLVFVALLSACGSNQQSNEEALRNAANQSEPAAAQVLNGAAENGMNAEQAMQEAGNAAAADNTSANTTNGLVQARPNLPGSPNPPKAGEPPQKIVVNNQ
jgi:predicted alpha/beta superfamily hydrolase